jgi:hypothetical protein
MPHFAIVVDDPDKEQAGARARHARHYQRGRRNLPPAILDRMLARVAPKRQVGDLVTVAAVECPDGAPNCRNCGDPAFADECRESGHCPHCGTRHGIAPQSYLEATGVTLVAVDPPTPDQTWDRARRAFVSRQD